MLINFVMKNVSFLMVQLCLSYIYYCLRKIKLIHDFPWIRDPIPSMILANVDEKVGRAVDDDQQI